MMPMNSTTSLRPNRTKSSRVGTFLNVCSSGLESMIILCLTLNSRLESLMPEEVKSGFEQDL